MFRDSKHVHFIGIGGSGISALAYLAQFQGLKVTGSDLNLNPTGEQLRQEGVEVFIGHEAKNVSPSVDLVIYSEAINQNHNAEYLEAKSKGLRIMSYFEALGQLSEQKKTIVVTGTHGKTTTTAMLGQALIEAGLDPTVIVGTRVPFFGGKNVFWGKSDHLVVEACEYRENFSTLKPHTMILLNCEWEHVDYYKTEAHYVDAYKKLASKLPPDGFLIYNQTDVNCRKIASYTQATTIPLSYLDTSDIRLKIPGDFNKLNAAHALKVGEQLGIVKETMLLNLFHFAGTTRRMEIKGELEGVLVIDDYAHHPTEIKATLQALKEKYPQKRLICVFQPHQYSRTYELLEDFKTAFDQADMVLIPNIYEARDTEEDKKSISAQILAGQIPKAIWTEDFEKALHYLKEHLSLNDLMVTMGAGDVYKIGEDWLLSKK